MLWIIDNVFSFVQVIRLLRAWHRRDMGVFSPNIHIVDATTFKNLEAYVDGSSLPSRLQRPLFLRCLARRPARRIAALNHSHLSALSGGLLLLCGGDWSPSWAPPSLLAVLAAVAIVGRTAPLLKDDWVHLRCESTTDWKLFTATAIACVYLDRRPLALPCKCKLTSLPAPSIYNTLNTSLRRHCKDESWNLTGMKHLEWGCIFRQIASSLRKWHENMYTYTYCHAAIK